MSLSTPGQRAAILSGITSPRQIPDLIFDFDAAALAPVADGTPIATWPDQSGNGNNATQATGTKQPLYTVNIQNGLPGLLFDGIDDSLVCSGPVPFFTGEDKPSTIIVVVKHVSVAATMAYIAFASSVSGAPIYALRESGNAINFIKRDDASLLKQTSNGVIGSAAARIITVVCTGTLASTWLDGVAGAVNIDVDIGTASINIGRIGSRDNAGIQVDPFSGYIFRVLGWSRALATSERKIAERLVANRWGVPIV